MSNFNQYDQVSNATPVLIAGDTFSFYANLDELEDDVTFSDWSLDLVDENFQVIVNNIGTLTQDVISGSGYRFYSSFIIPYGVTPGCCRLVISDNFYNTVKFISGLLDYKSSVGYTKVLRFRNSQNILNYNYE